MSSNVSAPVPETPFGTRPSMRHARRDAGSVRDEAMQHARAGFPGPAVTGVCMVVAPLLAIGGTALGSRTYHARGADFVAAMAAHPGSFDTAVQLAESAMLVLLLAVVGLAGMTCAGRPRLGRWAGVLAVVGLCGPISFELVYWSASHLADTAVHRSAAALLIDESQVIPRTVMNVTGPALVVGFVLLAVAAARTEVLSRLRAGCLAATALIPLGFISGYLAISLVGFAGTAVALVPLGIEVLRRR
ncbi:MAG TPA: hypothetical protein VFJ12_08450 [Segeticoccus sp.]|nr:hypothetical protein [Segeticoccus sp.]